MNLKFLSTLQFKGSLQECDRLRDKVLPELGVRLEDRTSQTCVKLVDKETLLREKQQKRAVEAAKEEVFFFFYWSSLRGK